MNFSGDLINNRYLLDSPFQYSQVYTAYKGTDIRNDTNVVIRIFNTENILLNPDHQKQFVLNMQAHKSLRCGGLEQVLDGGEFTSESGARIIFTATSPVDGIILEKYLNECGRVSYNEAIRIFTDICSITGRLHSNGLTHGDIRPGNIRLNAGQGEDITLCNPGLWTIIDYNKMPDNFLSEYFSYTSPECFAGTGGTQYLKRDIYSLGVLFYKLLTGVNPFRGTNPFEIIHKHMSHVPSPPSAIDKNIPQHVDEIVLRLVEKNPDMRFSSCESIIDAFTLSESNDLLKGSESSFHLNRRIERSSFIGRIVELQILREMFDSCREKKGGVCIFEGMPGMGKTRLLNEFSRQVSGLGKFFFTGSCVNRKNRPPFGPLIEIHKRYSEFFNMYPPSEKTRIRDQVTDLCGEVLAGFEWILPWIADPSLKKPAPEKYSDYGDGNEIYSPVTRFIIALAEAEGGIGLGIDDIQWADSDTIRVIRELSEIKDHSVLIATAFRTGEDNMVFSRLDPEKIRRYSFRPFTMDETGEYLAVILNNPVSGKDDFALNIQRKSSGNPFAINELLMDAHNNRMLQSRKGVWIFETGEQQLPLHSSIADIIIKRLYNLPEDDLALLSCAAEIGKDCSVALLAGTMTPEVCLSVSGKELSGIRERFPSTLERAEENLIIERNSVSKDLIRFTHDNIRDALQSLVPGTARALIHYSAGRALLKIHGKNTEPVIFDIAYHFFESGDRDMILQHVPAAASLARSLMAHEEAVRFLSQCIDIIENNPELKGHDDMVESLWQECMEQKGGSLIMLGHCDEAIEIFSRLLPLEKNPLSRAFLHMQMLQAYFKKGELSLAFENAVQGLFLLGEKLRSKNIYIVTGIIRELIYYFISSKIHGQRKTGKEQLTLIAWFYHWLFSYYLMRGGPGCLYSSLRMMNIARKSSENSKQLSMAYNYLYTVFSYTGFSRMGEFFRKKREESGDKSENIWMRGYDSLLSGFACSAKWKLREALDEFSKAIEIFRRIDDKWEYVKAVFNACNILFYYGDFEKAEQIYSECYQTLNTEIEYLLLRSYMFPYILYIARGEFEKVKEPIIHDIEFTYHRKMFNQNYFLKVTYGWFKIETGDIPGAIEELTEAIKIEAKNHVPKTFRHYSYVFLAEARVLKLKTEIKRDRKRTSGLNICRRQCLKAIRKSRKWKTFLGRTLRNYAVYLDLTGNKVKAERYLLESLNICRELPMNYELALTLLELGDMLYEKGEIWEAFSHYREAKFIFQNLGIKHREIRDSELFEGTDNHDTYYPEENRKLKRMSELSREILSLAEEEEILEKSLEHVMEITGAERGILFIADENDELNVHASKNMGTSLPGNILLFAINALKEMTPAIENNAEEIRNNKNDDPVPKCRFVIPVEYSGGRAVCYLDNRLLSDLFRDEDMGMLHVYISQALLSADSAKYRTLRDEQAKKDEKNSFGNIEKKIESITEFLKENYTNEISKSVLSRKFGLNADYLAKQFRAVTGKSIQDYLYGLRIEKAAQLLTGSDKQIIEIAMETGFKSLRTFNRRFHRKMHASPKLYRELATGNNPQEQNQPSKEQ